MDPEEPGSQQTNQNSNLLHTGVFNKPNSLKRKFCKSAYNNLPKICEELNVDHKLIRKEVLFDNKEDYHNFLHNNLHLKNIKLNKTESIIYDTYLIDFNDLTKKLLKESDAMHFPERISKEKLKAIGVGTELGWAAMFVCAGNETPHILGDEYFNVYIDGKYLHYNEDIMSKAIYHSQKRSLPVLGEHLTPSLKEDTYKLGPDSRFSIKNIKFDKKLLYRLGFFFKYIGFFTKQLFHFIPSVFIDKSIKKPTTKHIKTTSGIRTMMIDENLHLYDDFTFYQTPGMHIYACLNTSSPAASCCIEIADEMISMYKSYYYGSDSDL
jgi:L-2-hydroxyglutarate oxidase LhgO